jgi:hypothetical protein
VNPLWTFVGVVLAILILGACGGGDEEPAGESVEVTISAQERRTICDANEAATQLGVPVDSQFTEESGLSQAEYDAVIADCP